MPTPTPGDRLRDGRRPGWFPIDNEVVDDFGGPDGIGVYGFATYTILVRHANRRDDIAWPSMERIARTLHCSKPMVIKAIAMLLDRGLIAVESQNGKVNHYTIVDVPKRVKEAGAGKSAPERSTTFTGQPRLPVNTIDRSTTFTGKPRLHEQERENKEGFALFSEQEILSPRAVALGDVESVNRDEQRPDPESHTADAPLSGTDGSALSAPEAHRPDPESRASVAPKADAVTANLAAGHTPWEGAPVSLYTNYLAFLHAQGTAASHATHPQKTRLLKQLKGLPDSATPDAVYACMTERTRYYAEIAARMGGAPTLMTAAKLVELFPAWQATRAQTPTPRSAPPPPPAVPARRYSPRYWEAVRAAGIDHTITAFSLDLAKDYCIDCAAIPYQEEIPLGPARDPQYIPPGWDDALLDAPNVR